MNHNIEAVGVWFYSKSTNRQLYLLRDDKKYKGHWSLPGGKVEEGEALLDAITRECTEEMGIMPEYIKLIPIEKFTAVGDYFSYHTFYCIIEEEFIPELNHEHIGYSWINSDIIPKPVHPGLWATMKIDDVFKRINTLKDLYIN